MLQASCGRRARLVRRVNTCELLINTVIGNRPKMLTGLNQKVRGPVATSRTGSTWAQRPPVKRQNPP
uniref:Uncharacterized protein n=1 Tax=Escherichia coli TaxID=562 RepID=A0A9P1NTG1_ECOLX|nr:hypothetical protein HUS41_pII0050 [Escherichia coli]